MSESDLVEHVLQTLTTLQTPDAALRRPLSDLVAITLQTAGRSKATQRSYQTAIGLFLRYLDQERGDQLPLALQSSWRPFAEATTEGKRFTTVQPIRARQPVC